ncbi:nuclear transport factor 2 family protein [Schlesneria sp. T3-172]|uniref:nuclear transport factor 2 family protein n=1 Tax=Schlesneria TaxID=656899 RepID=UPI002F07683D
MPAPDASPNLKKLQVAYREWNDSRGESVQQWLDLMCDDVRMTSLSDGNAGMEFTKALTGKEQAKNYFNELRATWEMLYFHADEFIEQGDRVVMLGRCSFKSKLTGKSAESPKADFFRFRDGKIVEYFDFYDTAKAYAAATPDPT